MTSPCEPASLEYGPTTDALVRLLADRGITLEAAPLRLFHGLPTAHWQWRAVEDVLAQESGATPSCPVCCERLPSGPSALLQHVTDCLAASRGTPWLAEGKPFAVSASKLGSYFNSGECDRMLHRLCEREGRGYKPDDIEDLDKPLTTAHSSRGDLFEAQICNQLCSSGLASDWTGAAQDTTNGVRPPLLRFRRGEAAASGGGGGGGGSGGGGSGGGAGGGGGAAGGASSGGGGGGGGGGGAGVLRDLQEEAKQRWGRAGGGGAGSSSGPASLHKLKYSREHEALSVELLHAAGAAAAAANGTPSPPWMLFQPLFKAPAGPPFDHCDVSFSNSYVDFLLLRFVSGGGGAVVAELTVIDAKATGKVKVGAMVQVAYYALLLETLIATDPRLAGVRDHLRVARHGGVWLYGEAAPAPFLLREVRDKVDAFLKHGGGLRALLSRERKERGYRSQEWRLAPSCRNCGFHDDCRADALPAGASGGARDTWRLAAVSSVSSHVHV